MQSEGVVNGVCFAAPASGSRRAERAASRERSRRCAISKRMWVVESGKVSWERGSRRRCQPAGPEFCRRNSGVREGASRDLVRSDRRRDSERKVAGRAEEGESSSRAALWPVPGLRLRARAASEACLAQPPRWKSCLGARGVMDLEEAGRNEAGLGRAGCDGGIAGSTRRCWRRPSSPSTGDEEGETSQQL